MRNTKLYQWWNSKEVKAYWWAILAIALTSGLCVMMHPPEIKVTGFLIYGGLIVGLTISFLRFKKPVLMSVILAASILAAHAQQTPQQSGSPDDPRVLGCAIACVVLVIGAVVVYQLWSFCEAHLPPPPKPSTNNIPPLTNSCPTNFLGVYTLTNGMALPANRQSFALNIDIGPDGLTLTPASYWSTASADSLSFDGWCAEYSRITGLPPFPQPPAPENLQVGFAGGILSIIETGQATRTIVLSRSPDMRHWTPVATNQWSARFTRVIAVDMNAPQSLAFYKVMQQ
jgi:hypothetical protein